ATAMLAHYWTSVAVDDHVAAKSSLLKALDAAERSGDKLASMLVRVGLGQIELVNSDWASSLHHYVNAKILAKSIGEKLSFTFICYHAGRVCEGVDSERLINIPEIAVTNAKPLELASTFYLEATKTAMEIGKNLGLQEAKIQAIDELLGHFQEEIDKLNASGSTRQVQEIVNFSLCWKEFTEAFKMLSKGMAVAPIRKRKPMPEKPGSREAADLKLTTEALRSREAFERFLPALEKLRSNTADLLLSGQRLNTFLQ